MQYENMQNFNNNMQNNEKEQAMAKGYNVRRWNSHITVDEAGYSDQNL
jgi:hypothetical protein